MATLNPTLGSSVSFEQPVPQQPVASSLLDVAASFIGSAGTSSAPRQPSAADRQNSILQPFSQRLDEWRYESNMSDAEFTRNARRYASSFIASNPEYEGEVMSILGSYGVAEEPVTSTPRDAITTSFNDWLETPEGNSALVGNVVLDDNGNIDEEATLNAAERQFYEDNAMKTDIARTERELTQVTNNVELRNARATQAVDERFFPRWVNQAQTSVTTMTRLAASGAENLDSIDEQLGYIRRSRLEAETRFRDQAVAAGIPPEIYEPKIASALAPYDDTIEFIESSAGDIKTALDAFTNAERYGAEVEFINSVGKFAAIPEFRETFMMLLGQEFLGSDQYSRVFEGLVADAERIAEGGGSATNFNPFAANYTYATPEELREVALEGGSAVDSARVDTLHQTAQEDSSFLPNRITDNAQLMGVDTGNPADIKVQMTNISEAAEATSAPLGASILRNVFSPANVNRLQSIIQQGGTIGADVEAQVTYFVGKQIERNLGILTTNITQLNQMTERQLNEPFSGGVGARRVSVESIGSRNILTVTDMTSGERTVITSEADISGYDEFSRQLKVAFRAMTNINTLGNTHRRITNEDFTIEYGPQTRPVTGRGFPETPSDEMSVESVTPRGSFSQKAPSGGADKPVTQASQTNRNESSAGRTAGAFTPPQEVMDDTEFMQGVSSVAQNIGANPEDLLRIIHFETGGSYSPGQRNAAGSGATGLIQFMPSIAEEMGTTTEELAGMTRTQQLGYVERYLQGKLRGVENPNLGDLYMAVFWPRAVGRGDDYVLFSQSDSATAYNQNSSLDLNGDGTITRGEAVGKMVEATGGPQYAGGTFPNATSSPLLSTRPRSRSTEAGDTNRSTQGGDQRGQQQGSPQAVLESPRPVAREDSQRGKSASQSTTEEQTKRVQGQDMKLLQLLGRKAEDLPSFESQESLRDSVANGEVKEGDVVMLEGKVYVV